MDHKKFKMGNQIFPSHLRSDVLEKSSNESWEITFKMDLDKFMVSAGIASMVQEWFGFFYSQDHS